ncbi:MAG TPA: Maf family protein [Chthoniobacteraceae bacterium]|nr:Maf family protein [Chthoniobacteraceae bacterium]
MNATRLLLASASPRRRDLLAQAGYVFEVCPAAVDEIDPGYLSVAESTLHHARVKARAVADLFFGGPERNAPPSAPTVVVGVDTLVALDGERLGKPVDLDEARSMLRRLGGRVHQVYSGIWMIARSAEGERQLGGLEKSDVTFHPLDDERIEHYLARIEPLDKAGAYAAQDTGPQSVVAAIQGSRTNVIGLPMKRFARMLAEIGASTTR